MLTKNLRGREPSVEGPHGQAGWRSSMLRSAQPQVDSKALNALKHAHPTVAEDGWQRCWVAPAPVLSHLVINVCVQPDGSPQPLYPVPATASRLGSAAGDWQTLSGKCGRVDGKTAGRNIAKCGARWSVESLPVARGAPYRIAPANGAKQQSACTYGKIELCTRC
jgi:hypothetical protein